MTAAPLASPLEALVSAEGVSMRFGRHFALQAVDLRLMPGAVLGLVGPNGAGKSTLLGILGGHLRPTAGEVRWADARPRRGRLGVLPQAARLPPGDTCLGFLAFAARLQQLSDPLGAARTMLDQLGLSSQQRRARLGDASEGQRKLVAIGQAFLGEPEVILLDEPTSALDSEGRRRLRALVCGRRDAGAAVVISSHNLSELELLCDDVAVLAGGRLIAQGSMGSLSHVGLEVRFEVASGPIPTAELAKLPGVATLEVDEAGSSAFVVTTMEAATTESVIASAVSVLAARGIAVHRIARGRELEQVLIELVASKARAEERDHSESAKG